MHVAIITDDLSGGSALGAEFARAGLEVRMTHGVARRLSQELLQADVLICNTETRNVSADKAGMAVRRAAQTLREGAPVLLVKKIDSLLRGSFPVEIEEIDQTLGPDRWLLVAAAPAAGRTTIRGIQHVDGQPLTALIGELDPLARPITAHIPSLIQRQTALPVRHAPLSLIRAGTAELASVFASPGLVVADAETDNDIDRAVTAALEAGIRRFAGSYGLGTALIRSGSPVKPASADVLVPVLVIGGSLSRVSKRQISYLGRDPACRLIHLQGNLADGRLSTSIRTSLLDAVRRKSHLVLACYPSAESNQEPTDRAMPACQPEASSSTSIGSLIRDALDTALPGHGGLIVSGGSTAGCVLEAMEATGLRVTGLEVLPGMPICRVVGGPHASLPFMTKPGTFGNENALRVAIHGLHRFIALDRQTALPGA